MTRIFLSLALLMAAGCGTDDAASDDDASLDNALCMGAKCDAITSDTDPANLGFKIDYKLADPSLVGQTMSASFTPFKPPTYYPFTSDGINNRSNYTADSLPESGLRGSPAEKYDLAFSGWNPDESFWLLRKLRSASDTEFDAAYYEQLGPVATWEHNEHGLGRLHDGVDNDQDGKIDDEDDDNEGLEGWFGYCNGNTAASLSVPGPEHEAQFAGVTFSKNDIAALLAAVHYDDRSTMTGLRCESLKPVQDAYGRLLNEPWFKPEGAEENDYQTFSILQGPGWIDDENVGYLVAPTDPKPGKEKALLRLKLEEFNKYRQETKSGELSFDGSAWSPVQFSVAGSGCRDTNPATVYLAVTNLLGTHQIPFAIDADAASHVWNYPIYEARLAHQEVVDEKRAIELLELGDDVSEYPFNDKAVGFAHVKLDLTEIHAMNLEMVLELDADEMIIGGEWVGGSKRRHPDFIWLPMGADSTGYNTEGTYVTFGDDQHDGQKLGDGTTSYSDAPGMSYSNVRRILASSRTASDQTYTEYDGGGATLADGGSTEVTVSVDEPGRTVSQVLVYLDATADYVPGLKVSLRAPTGTTAVLFDIPVDNQDWGPGRFPNGYDLGTITGVAHPMPMLGEDGTLYKGLATFEGEDVNGEWALTITNSGGGAAQLGLWSLWLTSTAAPAEPPAGGND